MCDGLLCPSCREAIVRLLAIAGSEQTEQNEAVNPEVEAADYPKTKQNTRKAGS
jgi:hypothetical protein